MREKLIRLPAEVMDIKKNNFWKWGKTKIWNRKAKKERNIRINRRTKTKIGWMFAGEKELIVISRGDWNGNKWNQRKNSEKQKINQKAGVRSLKSQEQSHRSKKIWITARNKGARSQKAFTIF